VAVAVTFPHDNDDDVPPMRLKTSLQTEVATESTDQTEGGVFARIQQGGEYNTVGGPASATPRYCVPPPIHTPLSLAWLFV
jgi:hypothetical protein